MITSLAVHSSTTYEIQIRNAGSFNLFKIVIRSFTFAITANFLLLGGFIRNLLGPLRQFKSGLASSFIQLGMYVMAKWAAVSLRKSLVGRSDVRFQLRLCLTSSKDEGLNLNLQIERVKRKGF